MENTDVLGALQWLWDALTSPTSTWLQTLVSGAIGAAVGSIGTQWVISGHERLAQARAELRATNHAINICFTMVNRYIGFKRQMVVPMVSAYEAVDVAVRKVVGAGQGEIKFEADLKVFAAADLPIDHLERLILEHVPLSGIGLAAAMHLRGVDNALKEAVTYRSDLVQKIESSNLRPRQLAELYLGLETERGADTRFKDNVSAISLYANDCIFFSMQTAKALHKHGVDLIRKNGHKLGSARRSVSSFDFSNTPDNLIPPDEDYEAWLRGFPEPKQWWRF